MDKGLDGSAGASPTRILVALESPFSGDVETNIRYARACMRDSLARGEAPIASHLLYTQPGILDDMDPDEREAGMECGFLWNRHAQKVVVYADLGISRGMRRGIEEAESRGAKIEYRTIGPGEWLWANEVSAAKPQQDPPVPSPFPPAEEKGKT